MTARVAGDKCCPRGRDERRRRRLLGHLRERRRRRRRDLRHGARGRSARRLPHGGRLQRPRSLHERRRRRRRHLRRHLRARADHAAVRRRARRLLPGGRLARRRRRLPERVRRRSARRARRAVRPRAAGRGPARLPDVVRRRRPVHARRAPGLGLPGRSACTRRSRPSSRATAAARAGANERTDRDCLASCGNGVVEPGESCDKGAAGADACPTICPPSPSACLKSALVGDAATCTARCELTAVTTCGATRDGCCAGGCTAATDPGLLADLRRRRRRSRRTARPATSRSRPASRAPARRPAPTASPARATCWSRPGTCQAACFFLPITAAAPATAAARRAPTPRSIPTARPCAATASSSRPGETCDYGAGSERLSHDLRRRRRLHAHPPRGRRRDVQRHAASRIPSPPASRATAAARAGARSPTTPTARSSAATASSAPARRAIARITAGLPGACARTCDDGDACTTDWASGTVARLLARLQPRARHRLPRRRRLLPCRLRRRVGRGLRARLRRRPARRGRDLRSAVDLSRDLPRRRRSVHARGARGRARRAARPPAATSP